MPVAALFHVDWENMQISGTPDNSALGFTRNQTETVRDHAEDQRLG
jgi:hypothetical protein